MKSFLTFLFCANITFSLAQWNSDPAINTVVCATPSSQLYHEMIPDGTGGAFIAWMETDLSATGQIFAQHISQGGNLLWPVTGIAVAPGLQVQTVPQIIADGNGGMIISWLLNPGGSLHVYAQKISATGQPQWPVDGIAVCPAASLFASTYKMVSDGNGGAILIWDDNRSVQSRVYAQRISSVGSLVWQADGVPCTPLFTPFSQFDAITDTTTNGFFLCFPFATDLFLQRITGDGTVLWGANGLSICSAAKDQFSNKIISDGNSGAIILWQDFREDPVLSQIYGQRVDTSGTLHWEDNGTKICDSIIAAITYFQVVSDGAGGGIVAWLDSFVINQSSTQNLYAQRFNASGVTLLPGKKIAVWEDIQYISPFQMVSDYKQGSFITWQHASNPHPIGNETNDIYNVYAQHILPAGFTQWPEGGTLISSAPMNQYNPHIVCDNNGTAIIAWTDTRSAVNYDIYAARLENSAPVPVDWLSFAAERNGHSHLLKWIISQEIINKGFYIERSADGIHFYHIGFVAGTGNSSQVQSYSFTDSNPLNGYNYYRLKQVDLDGRFKYSNVIHLDIFSEEGILIYPNPVSSILKVKTNSSKAKLHILSSNGAVVKVKNLTATEITEIDISDLPAGLYYIKTDSNKRIAKFVKQ